jgi:prepilin-type N-terminal cleavage/methylation domain-containing protein
MKRKGFTLVELLVVIAIIALLMGILMPALARVRQIAYRMVCGTNLSGIGKAMLIYSNDNNESYPIAGLRNEQWTQNGKIFNFEGQYRDDAFKGRSGGRATITSSLYLLVRFADVQPKQFNCKGDIGAKIFKVSDEANDETLEPTEVWDFGSYAKGNMSSWPAEYCSYSYHLPYEFMDPANPSVQTPISRPVTAVSRPGNAVCADRSPYFDKNATNYVDGYMSNEEAPSYEYPDRVNNEPEKYIDDDKTGNAFPHQREGQNVLFADMHVDFERYANVGIDNDNIWKPWGDARPAPPDKQVGQLFPGQQGITGNADLKFVPWDEKDSVLVGDTTVDLGSGTGGRG